ncbi:hypothetical protein U1701_07555 [Sphingomonas sp. PB2P19]|uniref:hypothetical protein n=1 Tax=Sphingomonas rhamnosi TaxID=3096156 RepID=UPI002FCA2192
MRLSAATIDQLPANVARFDYDRMAQRIGIVHLGIGALARAHQAVFTDRAMAAGDRDWGIVGASLRSPAAREMLTPQDGLFAVTETATDASQARLIGSVRDVVVASPRAVLTSPHGR